MVDNEREEARDKYLKDLFANFSPLKRKKLNTKDINPEEVERALQLLQLLRRKK